MKSAILFWLSGIIALLFGVFVIVEPATVLNIAAVAFSLILAFRGLRKLIDALRFSRKAVKVVVNGSPIDTEEQKKIKFTMLLDGIISAFLGVLALIFALAFLKNKSDGIMKGVIYVIAAGFLYTGIVNLIENHRLKPYAALSTVFNGNGIVYIVAAVLLFIFPAFVGQTLMNVFGIILIIAGVCVFIWGVRVFILVRETKKMEKSHTVDYEEVK